MKQYYQILGISEQATLDDAKKAYRKLAMKYHPDRNPGNKNCEEQFKTVKDAFEKIETYLQRLSEGQAIPPDIKKAYEKARNNQSNWWNQSQNTTASAQQKKTDSHNQKPASGTSQAKPNTHSNTKANTNTGSNSTHHREQTSRQSHSEEKTTTQTRNFWQKAYDEKIRQEHARNQEKFKQQAQDAQKSSRENQAHTAHTSSTTSKDAKTHSHAHPGAQQKNTYGSAQNHTNEASHEFRLKLLLNDDIFFHTYESATLKLLNNLEDAGFNQPEQDKQLFHELYMILKNRKSDMPWLEILALCRYLDKMIVAHSWNNQAMQVNQEQIKRLALLTLRSVFGIYINEYHLIIREADYQKLSFIIEDSDEKMSADMLHHFFTHTVKHSHFQFQFGTLVEQLKIQVFYKHGYPARKVDYLKMLSLYQEKQVLTSYIEQLSSQHKQLYEQLLVEVKQGKVSFSAIVCLDNMPLHYTINRLKEMIAGEESELESYALFSVRSNQLSLNLDNEIIRTPDALEKLLAEKGYELKPWQAHESGTSSDTKEENEGEVVAHAPLLSWRGRKIAQTRNWLLRHFWMLQPTFLYL
jgi:curved DNA-binding protein CbpA